ncbi:MAG: hypothetical protein ACKOFI_03740, partial [Phycisphaerales bacterium]
AASPSWRRSAPRARRAQSPESVPGGAGTAELVSARPRGEACVDLVFRFTAAPGRHGPMYVPVMIDTATGQGAVFVAATVVP